MSKDITDALLQAIKCPVEGGFLDAGQYGNATVEELNQARHEIERLRAALAGAVEMTRRSSEEIDRLETALTTARDDALEEAAGGRRRWRLVSFRARHGLGCGRQSNRVFSRHHPRAEIPAGMRDVPWRSRDLRKRSGPASLREGYEEEVVMSYGRTRCAKCGELLADGHDVAGAVTTIAYVCTPCWISLLQKRKAPETPAQAEPDGQGAQGQGMA